MKLYYRYKTSVHSILLRCISVLRQQLYMRLQCIQGCSVFASQRSILLLFAF